MCSGLGVSVPAERAYPAVPTVRGVSCVPDRQLGLCVWFCVEVFESFAGAFQNTVFKGVFKNCVCKRCFEMNIPKNKLCLKGGCS